MASDRNDDAADERQNQPRRGIPGKGYDAGTGYGGGGNDSLYDAESSYGGQSGIGGSTMRGAYAGEGYGRSDDADPTPDMRAAGSGEGGAGGGSGRATSQGAMQGRDREGAAPTNVARDTDGRGAANRGEGPADPNVEAVTEAFEGRGAGEGGSADGANRAASDRSLDDGPDAVDLSDMTGASRREPGR